MPATAAVARPASCSRSATGQRGSRDAFDEHATAGKKTPSRRFAPRATRIIRAMRAIAITRPGGPEVLELVDRPPPAPSRGEVRVRVHATAINRADLLQRMGAYPAPADSPPDIPGLEIAGEVDALGHGVERLAIGDRVFGLVGG